MVGEDVAKPIRTVVMIRSEKEFMVSTPGVHAPGVPSLDLLVLPRSIILVDLWFKI